LPGWWAHGKIPIGRRKKLFSLVSIADRAQYHAVKAAKRPMSTCQHTLVIQMVWTPTKGTSSLLAGRQRQIISEGEEEEGHIKSEEEDHKGNACTERAN
jgi:hypothetical protein